MGYLCVNFGLPRPLCSRVIPDVRDRQTDVRQRETFVYLFIEIKATILQKQTESTESDPVSGFDSRVALGTGTDLEQIVGYLL